MRKIAFLYPNAITGKLRGELARRKKILKLIAGPDTEINYYGIHKRSE
jgi:hypothetical protein